jgi:hypothetical protein
MKMSVAELKRLLPVGTEYTAEFIGELNMRVLSNLGPTTLVKPENERIARRRVVKQNSQMVSLILDGPKQGVETHLHWSGITARKDTDGGIIVTNKEYNPPKDFLKIRLETACPTPSPT